MKTIHQKHQILASLDAMDSTQTEKVLMYIKGLLNPQPRENRNQLIRLEAMKQIRQALKESRF